MGRRVQEDSCLDYSSRMPQLEGLVVPVVRRPEEVAGKQDVAESLGAALEEETLGQPHGLACSRQHFAAAVISQLLVSQEDCHHLVVLHSQHRRIVGQPGAPVPKPVAL